MSQSTFRVVTRAADGSLKTKEYTSHEPLMKMHPQVGIDDCSTNLSLRGLPVFRGLIGPMCDGKSDGKNVVRYESPEVFETLTKEWSTTKPPKKTRRRGSAVSESSSL